MTARKTSAYGSWASPISPDLLLNGTVHMRNQMVRWDGDDLYWSELRPYEGGRIVVCRRGADGAISDVTPQGFNARSRVHEYGGGQFAVSRERCTSPTTQTSASTGKTAANNLARSRRRRTSATPT